MRSRKPGSRCRTKSRLVFLPPSWGWKRAHIHAKAHTRYVGTQMLSLSHTHALTHTVLLPNERETPAFPGQLTCRRTGCWTETHQLSQPETPWSQGSGTCWELWWIGFIHLFNWLPCSLSMGLKCNAEKASDRPET